jgi:alkylation response protein AidB-like acyl-CoA dehydrogenase
MEVAGLYGQLAEGPRWAGLAAAIEDFYLESVAGTIYLGSSELLRNTVAIRWLGLSR